MFAESCSYVEIKNTQSEHDLGVTTPAGDFKKKPLIILITTLWRAEVHANILYRAAGGLKCEKSFVAMPAS